MFMDCINNSKLESLKKFSLHNGGARTQVQSTITLHIINLIYLKVVNLPKDHKGTDLNEITLETSTGTKQNEDNSSKGRLGLLLLQWLSSYRSFRVVVNLIIKIYIGKQNQIKKTITGSYWSADSMFLRKKMSCYSLKIQPMNHFLNKTQSPPILTMDVCRRG